MTLEFSQHVWIQTDSESDYTLLDAFLHRAIDTVRCIDPFLGVGSRECMGFRFRHVFPPRNGTVVNSLLAITSVRKRTLCLCLGGGKVRLHGISKRGDVYLRTLMIHGARAAERTAKPDRSSTDA
jgi:hypothetical protein